MRGKKLRKGEEGCRKEKRKGDEREKVKRAGVEEG